MGLFIMQGQITIYGIKNCDKVKKALKWLDERNLSYQFWDYKKQGLNEEFLKLLIAKEGWKNILNQRGTTWRGLPENVRETMTNDKAFEAASKNTSLIKRPILSVGDLYSIGYNVDEWETLLIGLQKQQKQAS
jgi:arsenate reductase